MEPVGRRNSNGSMYYIKGCLFWYVDTVVRRDNYGSRLYIEASFWYVDTVVRRCNNSKIIQTKYKKVMKTKIISRMVFMALVALFSGCSSEDVITDSVKRDNLALTVSQENFAGLDSVKTRTTDSGTSTTFSSGDAIGIYVVNGSTVTNANLKYTYNGSSWSNDTYGANVPFVPGGKYFAYYPYVSSYTANSVTASATTADDFFANVISGWTPSTDQSTHDKYTAQDLMVSMATVDGSTGYTFSMAHQMALMEMDFAQILLWKSTGTSTGTSGYKYRFESHTPYDISGNGKYRLLVKPSTAKTTVTGRIYSDATTNSGAWYIQETSPAASNYKVYKYNSEEPSFYTCVPAVGSLYNSDGTCTNKIVSGKTPIGVVVSMNADYCESGNGYGHGLVMALNYITGNTAKWKSDNSESNLSKCTTYKTWYENVSGLSNQTTVGISDTYPAFKAAYNYTPAHPAGSSNWFIASTGQGWDAMEKAAKKNGATLTLQGLHSSTSFGDVSGDGTKALTALNKLMSSYSGLTYTALVTDQWHWTGSEWDSTYACVYNFSSNGNLSVDYNDKTDSYYVRPFLAFCVFDYLAHVCDVSSFSPFKIKGGRGDLNKKGPNRFLK